MNLCHAITFVSPTGLKCISARKAYYTFHPLIYSLRVGSCFVHDSNICQVEVHARGYESYFYIHFIKYLLSAY